jgi:hypothetical protein
MSETSTRVLDDLDLYTGIYRQMRLIRGFENLVQSLFLKGEVYGTTHLYSGQEAVATGVASLLEARDRVRRPIVGTGTRSLSVSTPRRCSTRCSGGRRVSMGAAPAR